MTRDSLKSLMQKVIELQKEFTDIDKRQFKKLHGYIHYPSISHSGISVTLTDEDLVKFCHFVSQYNALFLDKSGSFVSPLPWFRNEKVKRREICYTY